MVNSTLCAHAPAEAASDAGVAGAGVLLAFVITAGLALILSASVVFSEFRNSKPLHGINPRIISRKLLNSFSDQQIVEGIGIQAVGLAKMDTIIPYHFFVIWMLSLLSTATHLATLLALVQDFKRDWVLRWLRQFFMFVNLLLNVLYGIFVLESVLEDLPPTLPIACVWEDGHAQNQSGQSSKSISVVGTIAVIAISCIVFILATWYLHMRRQTWGRIVRVVSLVVLAAMAIGAAVRVIMVSQAFGTPSVKLSDTGEKDWSFGQLLGMLMLILPFISALEILRGEVNVPKTTASDDELPLNGNPEELKPMDGRYSYQPNPLWGTKGKNSRR